MNEQINFFMMSSIAAQLNAANQPLSKDVSGGESLFQQLLTRAIMQKCIAPEGSEQAGNKVNNAEDNTGSDFLQETELLCFSQSLNCIPINVSGNSETNSAVPAETADLTEKADENAKTGITEIKTEPAAVKAETGSSKQAVMINGEAGEIEATAVEHESTVIEMSETGKSRNKSEPNTEYETVQKVLPDMMVKKDKNGMSVFEPAAKSPEISVQRGNSTDSAKTAGNTATGGEPEESGKTAAPEMKNNSGDAETTKPAGIIQFAEADNTDKVIHSKLSFIKSDKSEGMNSEEAVIRTAEHEPVTVQTQSPLSEAENVRQTVQESPKTEPYLQVSREILTRLEHKGKTEFKMQLEPEALGRIDIKLRIDNGKLTIDIMAESPKTHALLTSQVDKLVMNMGLMNVQVENVTIGQHPNQQTYHQLFRNDCDNQSQAFAMSGQTGFSDSGRQENMYEQNAGRQNPQDLHNPVNGISAAEKVNRINLPGNSFSRMDYTV